MKKSLLIFLLLMGIIAALNAVPRELVVVEIGTGTWCGYCPGAAMGAHDLLVNGQPVAIVKNHNGDTFANTYSNARNTYYGITGFPTALFDGLNRSVGGSATQSMYSTYLPRVTARMAVPSHYTLSAYGSGENNNWNVTVNVSKPEEDTNTNVVLHACITQSGIPFNWGNQTTVENVNRLMVPSQNGTPVDLATGESTDINLTFATQAAWPVDDLELVIWLQNVTTKEILQGKKYAMDDLFPTQAISTDLLMYPDTSINATASLPITLANSNTFTVNGTISSDNPAFVPSVQSFSLAPHNMQIINVAFNPTSAQVYNGILTINSNFPDMPVANIMLTGTAFLNNPPVANNVVVTGPPVIYQTLTGSYLFSDPDNNTEGATTKQWLRIMNGTPTPITGATGNEYQLTADDLGYAICFRVTPVDVYGLQGTAVTSTPTPVIIPLPSPQNFTAVLQPPDTVVCSWQHPQYFDTRGFVGYRLYRDGLNIQTIPNPDVLTFTDTYVSGGTHEYYVCAVFSNPTNMSDPSNIVTVTVGSPNEDDVVVVVPGVSAFPNPFKDAVSFTMNGKANQASNLEIYNLKGQLVNVIAVHTDAKGSFSSTWKGTDRNGRAVDSGIYIYRWQDGAEQHCGKVILTK